MTVSAVRNENVESSLKHWHEMVEAADASTLGRITHPDAVFRSPAVFKPYEGRDALVFILSNVLHVFEDFEYHRTFYTDDGLNVTLEFTARVGDKTLTGADFIKFNEDGLIIEFMVMVRPMSGLTALADAMGARLAAAKA